MFLRDQDLELGCRIAIMGEKGIHLSRSPSAGRISALDQGSADRSVSVNPLGARLNNSMINGAGIGDHKSHLI